MSAKPFDRADTVSVRRIAQNADAIIVARKKAAVATDVLLLEAQHRIANSLQIVAGIALLKARDVASEEARFHLKDFHQRVMLVARLQRQLSANGFNGEIDFDTYLTELCEGLSQSMVADAAVSIVVSSNAGLVKSDEAVSLGMIVYELVINALKHGFPDGRQGRIAIVYERDGARWHLSVSDNGVGMRSNSTERKGGLGNKIVSALVRQLEAEMNVSFAGMGTVTTVRH